MSPPPGWFSDPWRLAPWRWWDGNQWTPYTWPALPGHVVTVSAAGMEDARRKEASLAKWAKVGLSSMLINFVGGSLSTIPLTHAFQNAFDQFSQDANGQPVSFHLQSAGSTWSYAILLVSVGVAIVFLVWQHAAATVARDLGYPARVSPGMGVASWFLPFASFWLPYQALSDMLPPAHEMRALCLRAWLAYWGAAGANLVAFFLALASTGAAVGAMCIGGVLVIYAFVSGIRLIGAVQRDHTHQLS